MSNKTNNLKAYLRDLYEGIVSKKPDASRNPQNFRSEIEAIRTGGELYEVMDASELPEDAPNGSLALVEGEPIPEAYTVSSVDELPSNAVDGSMAIVPSDSLIGRWKWHETLYFSMFNIPSGSYDMVEIVAYDPVFQAVSASFSISSNDTLEWNGGEVYYQEGEWDDTYEFIDIFTDVLQISNDIVTEEQFKTFIKTNADRLSGGYSLYTHENGQWVYKCEVV